MVRESTIPDTVYDWVISNMVDGKSAKDCVGILCLKHPAGIPTVSGTWSLYSKRLIISFFSPYSEGLWMDRLALKWG